MLILYYVYTYLRENVVTQRKHIKYVVGCRIVSFRVCFYAKIKTRTQIKWKTKKENLHFFVFESNKQDEKQQ